MTSAPDDKSLCPICWQPTGCTSGGSATCRCATGRDVAEFLPLLTQWGLADRCLCYRCATGEVPSPCTRVCLLDEVERKCGECGRTVDEIISWMDFDVATKVHVLRRLRGQQRPE